MRGTNSNFGKLHRPNFALSLAMAVLWTTCFPASSLAQRQVQKTFPSPQAAASALVAAAQNNDEKAMLEILGPSAKQIISSGDQTEDSNGRSMFVQRYSDMHRFVKEPDGTTTLYIGAENWPTPIPLVNKGNSWYFDTEAAEKEILYRRVGENELSTIRVCQQLVAAQKEYYGAQGSVYAQKIFGDEGQHNGLYWRAANGQPRSPIGPLVASAVAEGYTSARGADPIPYRGYYFRILTSQGKNAPGGAKSYVLDGKMSQGFAFLAYPAEYRSSGVMTFIVAQDGVVYRKDLGPSTAAVAKDLKEYNPDSSWKKDEDQQEESAAQQKPR
jgi:hypothetical protein